MRGLISLLILLTLVTFAFADEQTLFNGEITHGGYGGPAFKTGHVLNTTALYVGGGGGWIINHQFVLGGAGYGLVSEVLAPIEAQPTDDSDQTLYIDFGYGGVMMQYIVNSDKLVHYTFGTLVGAGGITYSDRRTTIEYEIMDNDAFMVIEPEASVVLNITRNFRISAGAKYLYIAGLNNMPGLKSSDFNGPQFNIMLKFGTF